MAQTVTKKGNKYQKHSLIQKEGEIVDPKKVVWVDCPKCDCCESKKKDGHIALCKACYFGWGDHQKLGKPKPFAIS